MGKTKNQAPAGDVMEVEAEEIHAPIVRTVEDSIKTDIVIFDKYAARMGELKSQYGGITINGVEDKEGYETAKVAARELRSLRTGTEADRKSAKEFYLECGRAIDEKAKQIVNGLLELEEPIKNQIKEVDEEKERAKQQRIQEQIQRAKERVAELTKLGVTFNGAEYVLDELSFSQEVIRESDDEYFNEKIVPQFREIFEAKEKIAKAHRDAEELLEKKRKEAQAEFDRQQEELQEKQRKLKELEDKIEADRKRALRERKKSRIQQLANMGMDYDFANGVFRIKDVAVVENYTEDLDEEGWEKYIADLIPRVEDAKKQIHLEKEAERKRMDEEAVANADRERHEKEEKDRQFQREILEQGQDFERWDFFIKSLEDVEIPIMKSRQYRKMMADSEGMIKQILTMKVPK